MLDSPIWYNGNLKQGPNLLIRNWYNRHYSTFVTFKNIYGVTGTFLDYQRVLANISDQWNILIRNNEIACRENAYKVACSIYIYMYIISHKRQKRCRRFYGIMVKTDEVFIQKKWLREVGNLNKNNFIIYNKVLLDLKEVALKDFQFKVNNKILVTKAFLHRIRQDRQQSMLVL